MNNITTGLKVLKSIIIKENLCSISIAKSDSIENVLWKEIIIKATREIQKQDITPSLFVREDLDKLIREIEKTEPFNNFPIAIKLGSLKYLNKLRKIRYGAWMSRLFLFN